MPNDSLANRNIIRLLVSHNIFEGGRMFFEIFLSIFIWKHTNSLVPVAIFNIAYLGSHSIFKTICSYQMKKGKVMLTRTIGLISYTVIYLVMFLMGDSVLDQLIPIGIAIGFANGLYWASFQIIRFDTTSTSNRNNYMGVDSAAKIVVKFFIPIIAGGIIAFNIYGLGYANIFLVGAILYIAALFIGMIDYKETVHPGLELKKTFKIMVKDKNILKSNMGWILSGFGRADPFVKVLLPILLFSVLQNELQLGWWLAVFALFTIFVSLFVGKFTDTSHYRLSIGVSGVLYTLMVLVLIFYPNIYTYIIFGILSPIVILFLKIPKQVINLNLLSNTKELKNHRVEYLLLRSWGGVGIGMTSTYIFILLFQGFVETQVQIVLFLMALAVLGETILNQSIDMDAVKAK